MFNVFNIHLPAVSFPPAKYVILVDVFTFRRWDQTNWLSPIKGPKNLLRNNKAKFKTELFNVKIIKYNRRNSEWRTKRNKSRNPIAAAYTSTKRSVQCICERNISVHFGFWVPCRFIFQPIFKKKFLNSTIFFSVYVMRFRSIYLSIHMRFFWESKDVHCWIKASSKDRHNDWSWVCLNKRPFWSAHAFRYAVVTWELFGFTGHLFYGQCAAPTAT